MEKKTDKPEHFWILVGVNTSEERMVLLGFVVDGSREEAIETAKERADEYEVPLFVNVFDGLQKESLFSEFKDWLLALGVPPMDVSKGIGLFARSLAKKFSEVRQQLPE